MSATDRGFFSRQSPQDSDLPVVVALVVAQLHQRLSHGPAQWRTAKLLRHLCRERFLLQGMQRRNQALLGCFECALEAREIQCICAIGEGRV